MSSIPITSTSVSTPIISNARLEDEFIANLAGRFNNLEDPCTDPIIWWKTYEPRFPNLGRMVRDYLAVPATSVPSERCFSVASGLITKQRGSMTRRNGQYNVRIKTKL